MMYAYIHGFLSDLQSQPYSDLSKIVPNLYDCGYDYQKNAEFSFAELCKQIEKILQESPKNTTLKLLGTSLGGFWALHLAQKYDLPCLAFNPVTFAHEQLAFFLGENELMYSDETFIFTEDLLQSYAPFSMTHSHKVKPSIIIGRNDEILDPNVAHTFWKDYANCILTDDLHSVANFNQYADIIR